MRRRDALKLMGSVACLSAASSATAGQAKKVRWKTAIGLNGFASSSRKFKKTYPIWEIIDFASRNGFDGVELVRGWPMGDYPSPNEKERIAALKRLYDAFGLQIFSLQTGAGGAFAPDKQAQKRWLNAFRDQARLAKVLGADCIGIWPGGPLRGQTIDEAIDRLVGSFREAGKVAADLGLLAVFEIEPPFVFNTEDHLRRILAGVDSPSLLTSYDPSHFDLMDGSTGRPHEMLKRIGVSKIGFVHLTDTDGTLRDGGTSKHLGCGDGHVDIPASLATLAEGGFNGWLMIDAWETPDPYDASLKGKRAIDRALSAT